MHEAMFGAGKETHHTHSPLKSVVPQSQATFEHHTTPGSVSEEQSTAPSTHKRGSMAATRKSIVPIADPGHLDVSIDPIQSTASHGRPSIVQARSSKIHPTSVFEALVIEMDEKEHSPPTVQDFSEFTALTDYFMGFWKAPHAAAALNHLEKLETKRIVRALQKRHGFWYPPPDVAEALKKSSLPATVSNLPDSKDGRNLKFVLKILGCTLHENKPYKQFLKARTLRQKRHWLYKYQGPNRNQNPAYVEPVCPARLKRLYRFFPDRFTEEHGFMYFNNKLISYDETKNLFYIGKELEDE